MMRLLDDINRYGRAARAAVATGALGLLVAAAGCSDLLDVQDPSFVSPPVENEDLLINRALSDFQVGYSGGGLDDKILSTTGLMSDEMMSAGTFTTRQATDRREQRPASQGNTSDAGYSDLHDARIAANEAAEAVGTGHGMYPVLRSLQAYSIVSLAENFCSGVPLSTGSATSPPGDQTPPLSTSELLSEAVTIFDDALANGGGSLPAVGKARALLNDGQFQAAASAVSGVPTDFVYHIGHDDNTSGQENPIFNLQSNGRYSVSYGWDGAPILDGETGEGGNGVPFVSARDPRVPVQDVGVGFDEFTRQWINLLYASRGADMPLASGVEARLIEAEAALQRGDIEGCPDCMIDILNDLRAQTNDLMNGLHPGTFAAAVTPDSANSLAPLSDPGTDAERRDLLFDERAYWLYNTGHRLGDLRRLMRQYGLAEDEAYPTGAFHKGGTAYGVDVSFEMHFDESNNPNYDLSTCDPESP